MWGAGPAIREEVVTSLSHVTRSCCSFGAVIALRHQTVHDEPRHEAKERVLNGRGYGVGRRTSPDPLTHIKVAPAQS
jgi:hypothetical protein